MSNSAIFSSLSGINAGFTRMGVSADNIARRGVPFAEKNRVIQSSMQNGGVESSVQSIAIPENERLDPIQNEYATSNIDYAEEMIQQTIANVATRANFRIYESEKKMEDSLLNITV